ncbi:Phosphoglycerate mutase-like protein AT74 [Glycine soja]|uniref:phosphoglycerate mutase-like protein AT74 n=1 Tax=Glycine soja TaxID=3848 RepID=UPI00103C2B36|nr:phosphoglycerate mutase-like protein AT74 [Glycine soja]KAH1256697.1 Phosphoglycerate mutase-like protein AT74 [Glycine max]
MTTYTTTPDHNIQLTTQGMTQALRVGEHLRHVIGNDDCFPNWRVQFYVSPYTCTQSMLHELKRCFLKKRIIDVREESRIREKDFRNFHVKERMNVIKEIHEYISIHLKKFDQLHSRSLHVFDEGHHSHPIFSDASSRSRVFSQGCCRFPFFGVDIVFCANKQKG